MTESHPIPPLATTAFLLTRNEYHRALAAIGAQTVTSLGLKESDNWHVNFDTGVVSRDVPDSPAPPAEV